MNIKTVLRGITGRPARLTALALVTTLFACDTNKILQVTDPDVARPDAFTSASAIPALFAGALGSFGNAFDGPNGDVEQVQLSGSLSDELINTETFPTRIEIDQRTQTITNTSLGPVFLDINRARASAERAVNAYRSLAKSKADSAGFAEALAINGYVYILFAENYCGSDKRAECGRNVHVWRRIDDPAIARQRRVEVQPGALWRRIVTLGVGQVLCSDRARTGRFGQG